MPARRQPRCATKFGSGPSVAFRYKDAGPWVFGLVANNIWTFGGASGSNATNQLLLNPFFGNQFGDGWALSSSPEIVANWIAKAVPDRSESGGFPKERG